MTAATALALTFIFAPAPEAKPLDPFAPIASLCDCDPCGCPPGRCTCKDCPCPLGQNCKPVSGPLTGWKDARVSPGAGFVWDAALNTWRPEGQGWEWDVARAVWVRDRPQAAYAPSSCASGNCR